VLKRESYGAILFVEDKEPTTREKFAAKLKAVVDGMGERLVEKLKDKAISGFITVTALGFVIIVGFIGARLPQTFQPQIENLAVVVVMQCDDDKIFDMQKDIIAAHGSKDVQAAVNKYCKVIPNDPINWIPKPK
jgi:hypothetical protein